MKWDIMDLRIASCVSYIKTVELQPETEAADNYNKSSQQRIF